MNVESVVIHKTQCVYVCVCKCTYRFSFNLHKHHIEELAQDAIAGLGLILYQGADGRIRTIICR